MARVKMVKKGSIGSMLEDGGGERKSVANGAP
ncbi:hypothetical protein QG37_03407 [Candidozyma auris]|nr:hypothetical protein QG37_03407 [[Candida] auris]